MTMHNTKYLVKRNTSCYNHVKMLGAKIYGFHKDKKKNSERTVDNDTSRMLCKNWWRL